MTRTIEQRITDLMREYTKSDFDTDTPLHEVINGFGDHYDFIMRLEDLLQREIPDDDVEACQTVGDLINLGRG